jgi:hypothetical protein
MDSLSAFMREIYIPKPDNRLTVKEIYEDFRAWIIGKYGVSAWNNITQRQVYAALKSLPDYVYIRYKEGYCLKGITYKSNKLTKINTENNPIDVNNNKIELPPEINNTIENPIEINKVEIPKQQYITLNITRVVTGDINSELKNRQIAPRAPRVPQIVFPTIGVKKQ